VRMVLFDPARPRALSLGHRRTRPCAPTPSVRAGGTTFPKGVPAVLNHKLESSYGIVSPAFDKATANQMGGDDERVTTYEGFPARGSTRLCVPSAVRVLTDRRAAPERRVAGRCA